MAIRATELHVSYSACACVVSGKTGTKAKMHVEQIPHHSDFFGLCSDSQDATCGCAHRMCNLQG